MCILLILVSFYKLNFIIKNYFINNMKNSFSAPPIKFSGKKLTPWLYFKRDKDFGICQINDCGKHIKTAGGSTSGLHTHLRAIHNLNILKRNTIHYQTKKFTNFYET